MNKNEVKIERTDFLILSVIEYICIWDVKPKKDYILMKIFIPLNGRISVRLMEGVPQGPVPALGEPLPKTNGMHSNKLIYSF